MPKEMLINVSEGEECRIALVEDGRLEELYMERTSSTSHVGNIYKGRVTNVEASIQAAFVDFGLGRNGFLHVSDLMPTYFGRKGEDIQESVGRKMARRDRPPIQRCLRRGDEIIVQIIKEGIGTKGPTLSSYLSIPGRILVMMPGMANKGVSKKIEDEEERRRLRQILDGLKPPKDVGFIIRTAGIGKTKADIQRDFTYLTRLWAQIEKKRDSGPGPMELYTEGDLVSRTVRDVYSSDVDRIVVDNKDVAKRVKEVIKLANPRTKNKVELFEEPIPLFHKYNIEKDIEQMHSRHVPLPSGGSLVIDSTEAIVAIDVNSGKFRDHSDAETTAFKTDMEAAEEIPRQLRLRDLGGVIICDFIDLRYERHRRDLEQKLHDKFKNDRAKTKVLRMSQFGIIEMTRQRMRPSLKRSIYFDCPHCKGAGLVKTPESMSLDVMRRLAIAAHDLRVARVELAVHPEVAFFLQNRKRASLVSLENGSGKRILVRADQTLALDEAKLDLFDTRESRIYLPELGMTPELPQQQQRRHHQHGQPQQGGGRRGGRGGGRDGDRRRGGGGGGGGGREQQGRRREAEPLEERFDLDRGEEAVDEREESRDEASAQEDLVSAPTSPASPTSPPQQQPRPQEQHRRPQRQESYSNYTDNDVDLGDEEPVGVGDDRGNRRDGNQQQGRRDDRRDQQQRQRHDQRRGGGQQPQQRHDQRHDQRRDQEQQQRHPQAQSKGHPGGGMGSGQQGGSMGEDGEGGHRRRRRRRRGGRGRGRNRNRQDQWSPDQGGQPVEHGHGEEAAGGEDAYAGEPYEHDRAEGVSEDLEPLAADDGGRQGTDRDQSRRDDRREEEIAANVDFRAPPGREPEPEGESESTSAQEDVAAAPADEETPKPAKKSRRGSRGSGGTSAGKGSRASASGRRRGRGKKSSAAASARAEEAAAAAGVGETAKSAAAEPPAEPVVKTGSSDRHHLIVDEDEEAEPVVPSPHRRPRTYRDLDEIPDDLE